MKPKNDETKTPCCTVMGETKKKAIVELKTVQKESNSSQNITFWPIM